jgi:hypothetical protein
MRRIYFLVPNTERVKEVHPQAEPEGTEPRVPAFP